MAIQEKLYTVDDLWAMESDPELEHRKFYLIDGVLYEDEMPKRPHARLQVRIGHFLYEYEEKFGLGEVTSECGFHAPEQRATQRSCPMSPFSDSTSCPTRHQKAMCQRCQTWRSKYNRHPTR